MTSLETPASRLDQANQLARSGQPEAAISLLKPLVEGPHASPEAATSLCYLLVEAGRPEEALAMMEKPFAAWGRDLGVLCAQGTALKAANRLEQSIKVCQMATAAFPASGVAEHNLAAALGDGHWFAESEAACGRALAKGLNAPETWLVRGRALQGLGRLDEAESAFRQVLRSRSNSAAAHSELAQLIWMRTEDRAAATKDLDAGLAMAPADPSLVRAKAKLLENMGDLPGAYAVFDRVLSRWGSDPTLNADAALLACRFDPTMALAHAQTAVAAEPQRGDALAALCQANFAAGRPQEALTIAEDLQRRWPADQFIIALVGMGWRMTGDARHAELNDYDRLVRSRPMATPDGWPTLEAYLADLAIALKGLHQLRAHPIGQSLRNGTQTPQCLSRSDDPVIQAFFTAVDAPIRDYLEALGDEGRVLGRPHGPGEGYRIDRAWSIRLRPDGFHVNHLHPKGWISSACYIELPAAVERRPEGWLRFGEPGIPTNPALPAEHYVKPQLGHMVLFPSYMWHGTVPFSGGEPRLSAAMDVIPL